MRSRRLAPALARVVFAITLATSVVTAAAAQRAPERKLLYAWTQAGADGRWLARMVYQGGTRCPAPSAMRARPDSAFPVLVCEYAIPAGAAEAWVGDLRFAPPDSAGRVVVIGDTGCRPTTQSCDDPSDWPFARVSEQASRAGGDLNVHVGDYIYRERCRPNDPGPCGDNWPTWEADWFRPVGPLLDSAPWVFARGNHEDCSRGGKGWFLFFDPRPYPAGGCQATTEPYAIAVPGIGKVLILDSACGQWYSGCWPSTGPNGRARNDSAKAVAAYAPQFRALSSLVAGPERAWLVTHLPIWARDVGGAPESPNLDSLGAYILQAALRQASPAGLPPQVRLSLFGHIHVWESVDFGPGRAPVMVLGNGGSSETDGIVAPPPGSLIDGVPVRGFWMSEAFGFTVLEAVGPAWRATLHPVAITCAVTDAEVTC